ncbi:thermonuclease family protein [Mesorhizobium sp. BAC0120]|uniref:thermonuclease family protein n=1 Tax=Mesorhizobium sp. BAC0120 TaxID=3090670 RepID=UPI00298C893D|nr:thermonuclease family protein [Mesorhizobium sp. BAC0120]MDW6025900.1 thermonuclease family protein [Mesorhizobium sp. BAC0120]
MAKAAFLTIVALTTTVPAVSADRVTGRASVIDGDTIEVAGQRIRFNGIDAPESWQLCNDAAGRKYQCGKVAADALDEFLAASRPVTCDFVSWDRYHRMVANCSRADGQSVNHWLVRNGHALDWPPYSHGAFAADQAAAEAERAGMWQGTFSPPWEVRAARCGGS